MESVFNDKKLFDNVLFDAFYKAVDCGLCKKIKVTKNIEKEQILLLSQQIQQMIQLYDLMYNNDLDVQLYDIDVSLFKQHTKKNNDNILDFKEALQNVRNFIKKLQIFLEDDHTNKTYDDLILCIWARVSDSLNSLGGQIISQMNKYDFVSSSDVLNYLCGDFSIELYQKIKIIFYGDLIEDWLLLNENNLSAYPNALIYKNLGNFFVFHHEFGVSTSLIVFSKLPVVIALKFMPFIRNDIINICDLFYCHRDLRYSKSDIDCMKKKVDSIVFDLSVEKLKADLS